jgi:hypothetical protein
VATRPSWSPRAPATLYCGVIFYTPWLVAVGVPAAVVGVGVALWGAGHKNERGAIVETVYGVQAQFYDGGWWTRVFQTHPVGPKAGSRIINLDDAQAAAETMNAHCGTYRQAAPVQRTATPWQLVD